MDKECRASVEEERNDRKSEARQKQIDALYRDKCEEFKAELSQGDIAEACEFFANMDGGESLVMAYRDGDWSHLGMMTSAAISSWIALQASKEVERAMERGEV